MQNGKSFAHIDVDGKMEGRQFCTVLSGTARIFHVGAWTGIEIDLICTALDIGVYRVVSAISMDLADILVSHRYKILSKK